MRAIEAGAAAVERAAGQAELASAQIELVAIADVEMLVDDVRVAVEAGGSWGSNINSPTEIELPGVLRARVVPGTPARTRMPNSSGPRGSGGGSWRKGRVADVAAARAAGRTSSRADRLARKAARHFGGAGR